MKTAKVLGYEFVSAGTSEVVATIAEWATTKNTKSSKSLIQFKLIATPNPEQLVLADAQKDFKKTLQSFDLLLPDGMGLVWGSGLLSAVDKADSLAGRVTGIDVVTQLLPKLWQAGLKVLLVGGQNYCAGRHRLNGDEFELVSVGTGRDGMAPNRIADSKNVLYWWPGGVTGIDAGGIKANGIEANGIDADKELSGVLKATQPAVVLVALGAPRQENWLLAHRQLLQDRQVRVGMVVGGAFDMILGPLNRAPSWVQNMGLEWLYRLYQEPWRWRRQLKLFNFLILIFREMLHQPTTEIKVKS